MSYFIAKMHQIRFRLRLRPDPAGRVYNAPQTTYLDLRGLLLREGRGGRTGGKGNGGEKGGEGTYF